MPTKAERAAILKEWGEANSPGETKPAPGAQCDPSAPSPKPPRKGGVKPPQPNIRPGDRLDQLTTSSLDAMAKHGWIRTP